MLGDYNKTCSVIASRISMISEYFVIKRSVNSIWKKRNDRFVEYVHTDIG